jgi:hypothetical protein
MAAEVTTMAEHADVLQYLLTSAVGLVALLVWRDVKRIEKRGDQAMEAIYGEHGIKDRLTTVEAFCLARHGEPGQNHPPRRRATDNSDDEEE